MEGHVNGHAQWWRVGIVNDHEVVVIGVEHALSAHWGLDFVRSATTVEELLRRSEDIDVVLLDVDLADGSEPARNVREILDAGARVLVFTGTGGRRRVSSALHAGAAGVVATYSPIADLSTAVRAVACGQLVDAIAPTAHEEATSVPGDARLSAREAEVLRLYAAGEKCQRVANRTGLAIPTVKEYVDRIRAKYASVGRAAPTKIDLFRRAVEDGFLPAPQVRVSPSDEWPVRLWASDSRRRMVSDDALGDRDALSAT